MCELGLKGASMTARKIRALTFGFLASTAIVGTAFAQTAPATDTTQPAPDPAATEPAAEPAAQAAPATQTAAQESDEIIITAQKREENLQNVPISVQALGTRRLDQLNISNFEEYTKQLPSVSYQNFGAPGYTVVYIPAIPWGPPCRR